MTSKINILKALSGIEWGADRITLLMLYRNMIRPKMTYGCVLYSSANDNTLKPLEVVQNKCLKIATGAIYCTKTNTLEVEAYIYPVRQYCDKMILVTAAKIRATYNHPLKRTMEDYNRYIGHQHQPFSTRAHLAAIKYRVPMDKIENIKEVDPNIWKHKKRHISLNQHLHKSDCPLLLLNEAKRMIQNYPGLVPFYTDGSNK